MCIFFDKYPYATVTSRIISAGFSLQRRLNSRPSRAESSHPSALAARHVFVFFARSRFGHFFRRQAQANLPGRVSTSGIPAVGNAAERTGRSKKAVCGVSEVRQAQCALLLRIQPFSGGLRILSIAAFSLSYGAPILRNAPRYGVSERRLRSWPRTEAAAGTACGPPSASADCGTGDRPAWPPCPP